MSRTRVFRTATRRLLVACSVASIGMGACLVDEVENNDTPAAANLLTGGNFGRGQISPIGDVDVWRTPDIPAGHLVFAYVDTSGSNTGKDSLLRVFENDGATLIDTDIDDGPPPGGESSSVIAGAPVAQGGDDSTHGWISQIVDRQDAGRYKGDGYICSSKRSAETRNQTGRATAVRTGGWDRAGVAVRVGSHRSDGRNHGWLFGLRRRE